MGVHMHGFGRFCFCLKTSRCFCHPHSHSQTFSSRLSIPPLRLLPCGPAAQRRTFISIVPGPLLLPAFQSKPPRTPGSGPSETSARTDTRSLPPFFFSSTSPFASHSFGLRHCLTMESTRQLSSDSSCQAKKVKKNREDAVPERDLSESTTTGSGFFATAYIALGSNLEGTERLGIIERAIGRLSKTLGPIQSTSCLYETVPGFDVCPPGVPHDLFHPFYLNAVVKLRTSVTDPWQVLEVLKSLEAEEGRPLPPSSLSDGQRNNSQGVCSKKGDEPDRKSSDKKLVRGAPRSLDLDLLFMDDERGVSQVLNHRSNLPRKGKNLWEVILPHPRIATRNFVLFPLCDIDPLYVHPVEGVTLQELLRRNLIRRRARLQSMSDVCGPGVAGEHGYTLDGCLTIPRRCFAARSELLWTVGGRACVRDTLRYIGEVKAYARRLGEEASNGAHGSLSHSSTNGDDSAKLCQSKKQNGEEAPEFDRTKLHLSETQLEQLEWLEELESSLEKEHMLRVMGILNVSPDSFTDHFAGDVDQAVRTAEEMLGSGADVIDIGGEATNPFKEKGRVPTQVEIDRVSPVVEKLRERAGARAILSVDTMKGEVARHVKATGADWINDQTGEQRPKDFEDPLDFVSASPTTIVIMHKRGTPDTFDQHRGYDDVVRHVGEWLARTATALQQRGVGRWRIMADVGLGLSKSQVQSYALLGEIQRIKRLLPTGIPQLVGFSRKRFVGYGVGETLSKAEKKASPEAINARRWGGAAIVAWCARNADAVALVRTHDVQEACHVRNVMECISRSGEDSLESFDATPDISALFPFWPYDNNLEARGGQLFQPSPRKQAVPQRGEDDKKG